MTVFYNLVASWWNDFWSKITVLEPLLLQDTVNTSVLRRFLQQIHPPTATRSVFFLGGEKNPPKCLNMDELLILQLKAVQPRACNYYELFKGFHRVILESILQ